MKEDYENISKFGIQFKHLISAPAPVGRILNYVKLIGRGVLKHKNGNRDLYLKDNIGYAWTTEFMVGLGLAFYIEDEHTNIYPVYLTPKGKELFELIKGSSNFDENQNPSKCREQLMRFSKQGFLKFESIFKASVVCKNLCKYMANNSKNTFKKSSFMDEYFGFFKKYYTDEDYIYSAGKGATTGDNRMPSLIQLCSFFNCLRVENGYYVFDYDSLNKQKNDIQFIPVDTSLETKLANEDEHNEIIVKDLVEKYGIDGTVAREIVTRNSSVQEIFRNNLIARYGCKCAICSKDIDTVLVASHIKPASECNVLDKANCENGLLLCALHDKLFDRYLISFDFTTGKLIYSKELEGKLAEYQLNDELTLDSKYMTEERKTFLMQHNMAFYERNK